MEYSTVLLAALFHDIGKFLQKGDFPASLHLQGRHPAVSAEFVTARRDFFSAICDADLLRELVQRHHERPDFPEELQAQKAPVRIRHLACLLSKADNYSSHERGAPSDVRRDYRKTPLLNCLSLLRLDKPTPPPEGYQPAVLKRDGAFPRPLEKIDPAVMNRHLQEFGAAFDRLAARLKGKSFETAFAHLVALLRRFTWCVPSNTQEALPDVSLYDHLRTTCAIAACLYRYHQGTNLMDIDSINDGQALKFRLVAGDLSGIQRYIFGISSIGAGGIAKRLRARSFFLASLMDGVAHRLLHAFSLPLENIIVSSGGHFHLLVPNTSEAVERIERLQQELDRWSLEQFGGEVRVTLAHCAFSGGDFRRFSSVLAEVRERLAERKARPLTAFLAGRTGWIEERFIRNQPETGPGLCAVCGRGAAAGEKDGVRQCDACRRDLELGSKLARARYLVFTRQAAPEAVAGGYPMIDGYAFDVTSGPPGPESSAYLVVKFNDEDLSELSAHPASFRYLANHIPLSAGDVCRDCSIKNSCGEPPPGEGDPLYFDCLAARAGGRKFLGYLKADVDHLGTLLLLGLRGENEDRMTISRLATISRMLDLFFAGWVNALLESRFTNCYTVFSGGDDLFVVGPWDEVIRFAVTVREDFTRFTGGNPNITLSAGLALAGRRVPLSLAAANAEDALETAKERPACDAGEGRDQFGVLGDVVKWRRVPALLGAAERMAGWHARRCISTGFLYRLKSYGAMYRDYLANGRAENLRFIPLLTYDAARNLPDAGDPDPERAAVRRWIEELRSRLGPDEDLAYLPLIVSYALLTKE